MQIELLKLKAVSVLGAASVALVSSAFAADSSAFEFQSFQTHTHLRLGLAPSIIYKIEKVGTDKDLRGLRIELSGLSAADLRALSKIVGSQDVRTQTIQAKPGSDKVVLEIQFAAGAVKQGVEYFDYRKTSPSEVGLDYWTSNSVAANATTTTSSTTTAAAKAKAAKKPAPKLAKAAPASGAGSHTTAAEKKALAEASAALEKYGCGRPITTSADPFTLWKVYHRPFEYRAFFNLAPADSNYTYPLVDKMLEANGATKKSVLKGPTPSKEVAHYLLAHRLYRESKYALTLRTIQFFDQEHPESELKKELFFLRASTMVQLAKLLRTDKYVDQANELYRQIILEEPDSKRASESLAYLTQELMSKGNSVNALEYALMGAEYEKDLNRKEVYRLAAAESLQAIGELDRAERSYQAVIDHVTPAGANEEQKAFHENLRANAAYRIGEIFVARGFYERGIIAFERAIERFPKVSQNFPSAYFNLAESYFRIGNLDRSKKFYNEYLERFSSDTYGWAAALRTVEIDQMQITKPSEAERKEMYERYSAVLNRYPYTPGAMLAQLRLAECGSNKEFFSRFFSDRDLVAVESPLIIPTEVQFWFDIAEARFALLVGEFELALRQVPQYRSRLESEGVVGHFKEIYEAATLGLAQKLAHEGAYKQLLEEEAKYGDFVPAGKYVEYELALSEAEMFAGRLQDSVKRLEKLKAKSFNTMTTGQRDEFYFLEANRMKLIAGKDQVALLSTLLALSDTGAHAAFKYEELSHLYDLGERLEDAAKADEILLAKTPKAEEKVKISARQVERLFKMKRFEEVAREADRAILRYGAISERDAELSRIEDARAMALYEMGKHSDAVSSIKKILEVRPDTKRRAEFEFKLAKGLAQLGHENEALETFRKIASATDATLWKKSAQAEIDHLQWQRQVNEKQDDNQNKDRRSLQ